MWFEDAVELQTEGKTVRAHLLIGTAILWEAFGAESLSKVADRLNRGKSEELSTGDYFGAGLDTGIGKGVKGLGKLGKSIGGFFSKGFERFSGFFKTLRKNGDKVEEVVDAGKSFQNPYKQLSKKSIEKSKASYEELLSTHKKKLSDYIKNPDAYDDKGILKNATPELRKKIIQGRIKVLQDQMRKHEGELKKIEEALKEETN